MLRILTRKKIMHYKVIQKSNKNIKKKCIFYIYKSNKYTPFLIRTYVIYIIYFVQNTHTHDILFWRRYIKIYFYKANHKLYHRRWCSSHSYYYCLIIKLRCQQHCYKNITAQYYIFSSSSGQQYYDIIVLYKQFAINMDHLEKHDALSPLPPPHQKYLENAKKVKKTTKSAIFMKICNTLL